MYTGFFLVGVVVLSFLLTVYSKTHNGQGLETFFTGQGVKFNYIGSLVLWAIILVILIVGLYYNFKKPEAEEEREARELEAEKDRNRKRSKYKLY